VKVKPGKADLPPPLRWEAEIWQWFWRLAEPTPAGTMRVPGHVWQQACDRNGWCPDIAFGLLQVVHAELAKAKAGRPGD